MSTAMFLYKIRKQDIFPLRDVLAEYIERDTLLIRQVRSLDSEEAYKFSEDKRNHYSMQLFDGIFEDYYLVRFISRNYIMENALGTVWHGELEEYYYDDRSNMDEEEEARLWIVDAVEALIYQKHYFIVYIIRQDDILHNYYLQTEQ